MHDNTAAVSDIINDGFLKELLPPEKTDEFFDALYGGAEVGAFDISLHFAGFDEKQRLLQLEFRLTERPGKCMACNLTYGLPEVFSRHPIINAAGIVDAVVQALNPRFKVRDWSIGSTQTVSSTVNVIPLFISLEDA